MKKPAKKTLDNIDMRPVLDNIPDDDTNRKYIDAKAGQDHYRLLVWLGKKAKKTIVELGTFRGHSALCLGLNGARVISFDIQDQLSIIEEPDNVGFFINDNGQAFIDHSVDLVFLDTLHDGVFERKVLNRLRHIGWKGILVMDDIVEFPALADLWEEIPEKKQDWTSVGHYSGTGLIFFE